MIETPRQTYLRDVLRVTGSLFKGSETSTGKWDFWESRLAQARNETDIMGYVERLAQALQSTPIAPEEMSWLLRTDVDEDDRRAVLAWIATHPKDAVSLAWKIVKKVKEGEVVEPLDLSCVSIPDVPEIGELPPRAPIQYPIQLVLTSPLSHGSQERAGNFGLFRRKRVMTTSGAVVSMPYYAATAFRGQLRDIAAVHFMQWLGLKPALWFFHFLFSGGGTAELPEASKKRLGEKANARSISLMRDWTTEFPIIGLFGGMLSASSFSGAFNAHDFEPYEGRYKLDTGEYLTRRDDSFRLRQNIEGDGENDKNNSMIASCETMMAGSILLGGVTLKAHAQECEKALLRYCIEEMSTQPIGGQARRGWGLANWNMDISGLPESSVYMDFINDRRKKIVSILTEAEALARD